MGSSTPSGAEHGSDLRSGIPRSRSVRLAVLALTVGVIIGGSVAVAAVTRGSDARPDATLQATGTPPDELVLRVLEPPEAEHLEIDLDTLRSFGTHEGIELWSASNAFGSSCVIAIHRRTQDVLGTSCVPVGATTFVDTIAHGLPIGAAYRFTLRSDAVDVSLLLPDAGG